MCLGAHNTPAPDEVIFLSKRGRLRPYDADAKPRYFERARFYGEFASHGRNGASSNEIRAARQYRSTSTNSGTKQHEAQPADDAPGTGVRRGKFTGGLMIIASGRPRARPGRDRPYEVLTYLSGRRLRSHLRRAQGFSRRSVSDLGHLRIDRTSPICPARMCCSCRASPRRSTRREAGTQSGLDPPGPPVYRNGPASV